MNKKYLIVIGGLLTALLVVGIVGATSAYAQRVNPPGFGMMDYGRGPGGGHGWGLGDAELEAAAKVLGMTADELSSALQSGKTLQDLANEKGVAIEDVQTAIQAAHAAEMRDDIAQAVADGTMTQEKADWLNEGLDQGFIGGGEGFGPGFGGPHGHGGFGKGNRLADCPMQTPSQTGE